MKELRVPFIPAWRDVRW